MNTPHHLTALLSLLLCSCGQSQSSDAPVPTVVDTAASSLRAEEPERAEEEVTFGPFRREDLRGGYHVLYTVALDTIGTGDTAHIYTAQIAQLWKDTLISEISSCSYGLPEKNLGYVQYDFDDWFLYIHGFGPGNPIWAQVIEKESGHPMVGGIGTFYYLDVDTINQYVLLGRYGEGGGGVRERNDTLFLIGADARSPELFYPLPEDVDGTEWYIWTTIASLTRDRLVIQYEALPDGTKKAEYRRR